MKKLRTTFTVMVLILAVSNITFGNGEFWGVHLSQSLQDGDIWYDLNAYSSFGGTVTTPNAETLGMGTYEETTLLDLTTRFPDGTYTFDDGAGGTYLAELGGPFPGEFPNITSTTFNITGDLIIAWDLWQIGKSNPRIDIWTENNDYYTQIDASSTQHTIPASELPSVHPFDVAVCFKNVTIGAHGDKATDTVVEVPEPATVTLLGLGSLIFASSRKKIKTGINVW